MHESDYTSVCTCVYVCVRSYIKLKQFSTVNAEATPVIYPTAAVDKKSSIDTTFD